MRQKSERITQETVDFFDSAAGIRFFKKLKGTQNKKRFVGTVWVFLHNVTNNAVVDFIEELFGDENISFNAKPAILLFMAWELALVARIFKLKSTIIICRKKRTFSELLDKCVLLNTYFDFGIFLECEYINGFDIYYRIDCFE